MMAHLLGNKYCIDSLQNDVADIQDTITNVFSRSGPVGCPSWKYPDKIADDLDIAELLDLYSYSDDVEDCQVAHVVLLELVIDRLLLLLQAVSKYADQSMVKIPNPGSNTKEMRTSAGLVVKQYWNRVVLLNTTLQQHQSESKSCKRKIHQLETALKNPTAVTDKLVDGLPEKNSTTRLLCGVLPLNDTDSAFLEGRLTSGSNYTISKDEYNKSCQTIETAFVPCESCYYVQKTFRETGNIVINMCEGQGLPCSLVKFKTQVQDVDWLSANDVCRWDNEQNQDMGRISKHFDNMASTTSNLQENLTTLQKQHKDLQTKLQERNKEMSLEKETQFTMRKQYEAKIADTSKQAADKVSAANRQLTDTQKAKQQLELQLHTMKKELENQQGVMVKLESVKVQLTEKLKENTSNQTQVDELEKQVKKYKTELSSVNKEINKEKALNKSAARHKESVQSKQEVLVQRLDELDCDNQDLRGQVCELESISENLKERLDKTQDQLDTVKRKNTENEIIIKKIEKEKQSLETSIQDMEKMIQELEGQMEKATQQERLLTHYPDLNGLIKPQNMGTGDIIVDMESQLKANSLRIQILEEQNTKLRHSITKLLQSQTKIHNKTVFKPRNAQPVALWTKNDSVPQDTALSTNQSEHLKIDSASDSSDSPTSSPVKHSPAKPSPSKTKTSPSSTNKPQHHFLVGRPILDKRRTVKSKAAPSSVNTYAQLKKAGLLQIQGQPRPQSGKRTHNLETDGDFEKLSMYSCYKCDKMYPSEHDLEVHKSYCFGGL